MQLIRFCLTIKLFNNVYDVYDSNNKTKKICFHF